MRERKLERLKVGGWVVGARPRGKGRRSPKNQDAARRYRARKKRSELGQESSVPAAARSLRSSRPSSSRTSRTRRAGKMPGFPIKSTGTQKPRKRGARGARAGLACDVASSLAKREIFFSQRRRGKADSSSLHPLTAGFAPRNDKLFFVF